MKESIGMNYLISIVLVFLVLVFMFITAIMSYFKAYKVNTKVVNAIENHAGYNYRSKEEIDQTLGSIKYLLGDSTKCPSTRNNGVLVKAINFPTKSSQEKYKYCVYRFEVDACHYTYGVVTYMEIHVPIIQQLVEIPVYAKTDLIYRFDSNGC